MDVAEFLKTLEILRNLFPFFIPLFLLGYIMKVGFEKLSHLSIYWLCGSIILYVIGLISHITSENAYKFFWAASVASSLYAALLAFKRRREKMNQKK